MDNFKEIAKEYAEIELTETQLTQFNSLATLLLETNKITNLTAIRDEEGVYMKHFLDSLTLLKALPTGTKNIADIGSGAGFPGLPLAIARPDIQITMIESIGKKTSFIKKSIETLNLPNAKVIKVRAETLAEDKNYRRKFDVATARAVAFLPDLIKTCIPFVRPKGVFIAMKNENETEIDEARKIVDDVDVSIEKIIPINIQTLTPRQLIVIQKK